uniref:cornifelin-like n=1 Tax=Styela clava TaxID=7725 RepID=UPI00193A4208|nr:cornifelin-like [Styela clava]
MDDKQLLVSSNNPNPYDPVVSQPHQSQQYYSPGAANYHTGDHQVYAAQSQGQYGVHSHSVVVSAQPQSITSLDVKETWSTGLMNCGDDIPSCLLECFLGPFAKGNLATRLGQPFMYGFCCGFHFSTAIRPYFRAKHNIQGDLLNDCFVTAFCGPCNMCQISREMDRREYPKGCLY